MMEKIPESSIERTNGKKEYIMEDFLAEIQGLQEQQRTEEHISEDLASINSEDLTSRDMEMWRLSKSGGLTYDVFMEYTRELYNAVYPPGLREEFRHLVAPELEKKKDVPNSRYSFRAYLGNLLNFTGVK